MNTTNTQRTPEVTVRAAMKWWRANHPDESPFVTVRSHGWFGRCLWTTRRESGAICSVSDLLRDYRAALAKVPS